MRSSPSGTRSSGGDLDDSAIPAVPKRRAPRSNMSASSWREAKPEKKNSRQTASRNFLSLDPNVRRYVATAPPPRCSLSSRCWKTSPMPMPAAPDGRSLGTVFGILRLLRRPRRLQRLPEPRREGGRHLGAISEHGFILYAPPRCRSGPQAVDPASSCSSPSAVPPAEPCSFESSADTGNSLGSRTQAERQELLRQLVDLQDKLRSGEQSVTFSASTSWLDQDEAA